MKLCCVTLVVKVSECKREKIVSCGNLHLLLE
jgi:hypothetical protein